MFVAKCVVSEPISNQLDGYVLVDVLQRMGGRHKYMCFGFLCLFRLFTCVKMGHKIVSFLRRYYNLFGGYDVATTTKVVLKEKNNGP